MTEAHRAPRRRLATALLLALHLVGGTGIAIGEALAQVPVEPVPHLTSAGDDPCPPLHDHLDCQLCRTLRLAADPAARSAAPRLGGAVVVGTTPCAGQRALSRTSFAPLGSRAPPLA